jgi:cyclopropane-fatty-acyl-phospholipid synthase
MPLPESAKRIAARAARMWEFYLRGARYVFLDEHHVVWQIQLAKNIYALPNITRDYIAARENELREKESKPAPDLRLAGNEGVAGESKGSEA